LTPANVIFIASPLEAEHVARLSTMGVPVFYRPQLLPPTRYQGDHTGASFTRGAEQEAEWRAGLAEATILWDFPEDMVLAPRARWVQATSTGVAATVRRLGLQTSDLLITTARGVHGGPLAEFVMLGLLAHFRGLRQLEAEQRAHSWVRYCGGEIHGKTLVLVGAGDLAQATARLAGAFGMRVEAVTRNPAKDRAGGGVFDAVHPTAELHAVLGRADAVVLTTPQTPLTEGLFGAAAFASLRPGAAFVNIARGAVVDEAALVENLRSGHVGFAALDVTTVEPLPAESRLWDMPNVLISPHSASTVAGENGRITEIFCENLEHYLAGNLRGMKNIFDKQALY